jgi:hypothetical protein
LKCRNGLLGGYVSALRDNSGRQVFPILPTSLELGTSSGVIAIMSIKPGRAFFRV